MSEAPKVPTRLARLGRGAQKGLVNWGYATADAALRTHVDPAAPAPERLPYPD